MKIKTAEGAAFIVATVMAILSIGGAAIDYFMGGKWEWYYISYAGGVFVGGYYISRWVIRRFIVCRIKPIYEMALERNITIRELESEFTNNDKAIEEIGNEVAHWAETNKEEIERLNANEQLRREFLGDVSHELKTPLFNIEGYVNTLLDGAIEDPKVNREYLERMEKNVERLINIVNNLNALHKLETGTLELNKNDFDIMAFTKEIADTLQFQARERDIKVSIEKSDAPVMVYADKRYIGQVLINLISNAISYGNRGGKVLVSFVDMFEKVGVEVRDDGIGIAKKDLPHIFGRFYRTDKSRSSAHGGSGLGLSIVKQIISAHEEGIVVRSHLGKGSTFTFTLPKSKEPEDVL